MAPDSAATPAGLCGRPRHHPRAPARSKHRYHYCYHPRRRKMPGNFSNIEYAAGGRTIQAVGEPPRKSSRVTRLKQQQNRVTVRRLVRFSGLGDRLQDMATHRGLAAPCFCHTAIYLAIESFILSFCTVVSCMLLLNQIILR
ncbi:hypothetical protein M0657_005481 [Pyricularia oryzae]|nr:hypothetical protein M9X92_007062 [Pyricularia oryzae]KAI7922721.1 hypothetical protein M0657_005481 [Pyricularia oryzae]